MKAAAKLAAARTKLLLDDPFFGTLVLRLKPVEDQSCETMWVDGVSLGYKPSFVEELSADELLAVLAHEVMHCAAGHPWREEQREHERWNEAADRAINPMLRDAGYRLPANVLFELEPSHKGQSAEWIYDRLPQPKQQGGGGGSKPQQPQQGQGGGKGQGKPEPGKGSGQGQQQPQGAPQPQQGQGQPQAGQKGGSQPQGKPQPCPTGEVRPAPAGASEQGSGEPDWQAAVQQAAAAAKARGKLPGSLERFAKEAAQPRVDWRSILRRFAQEVARADFSWRMPSARYMARGLYLPALRSEEMGPMVVAIDTSGSIDEVLYAQFMGECASIADELQPSRVIIMLCDAALRSTTVIERGDAWEQPRAQGGGGTSFRPVFAAVAELEEQPACLVYLTDMLGSFPEQAPEYPVLWATLQERPAPFGEVVRCA